MLQTKLAYWKLLPWALCGMAHHDPAEAQKAAQECLDLYQRDPDPSHHHRLTVLFLAPGSELRSQVEAFASGVPLKSLRALRLRVAKFQFIAVLFLVGVVVVWCCFRGG